MDMAFMQQPNRSGGSPGFGSNMVLYTPEVRMLGSPLDAAGCSPVLGFVDDQHGETCTSLPLPFNF
jgi:hypothetical protein